MFITVAARNLAKGDCGPVFEKCENPCLNHGGFMPAEVCISKNNNPSKEQGFLFYKYIHDTSYHTAEVMPCQSIICIFGYNSHFVTNDQSKRWR
jgi:hypothetical protein